MNTLNVIEEKYIDMALELAAMGIEENEIIERIENVKNIKEIVKESKSFRNAVRIKKNNRVGYVAYK